MHSTISPSIQFEAPEQLLSVIATRLEELTPELKKAAAYVLENPNDVGVSSMREIADAAQVKPNTLVRMARSIGLKSYEDFRHPFREQLRRGKANFPDQARWLQSLSKGGKLNKLYGSMVTRVIDNIEQTFTVADAPQLEAAARAILKARQTYVLGVGINHSIAHNFAYLAEMALDNVHAIPRQGNLAIDDLAFAKPADVLLAMTYKPYRREVVDAVRWAQQQQLTIVSISDSPASPIVANCEHSFVVCTETPQFFTSTVATTALLETLMAYVIAGAEPAVIANIEKFHRRRHSLGIYCDETRS